MANLLLFHHAQGLTPGVLAFADQIRLAGHTVHVPDLYEGRRFDTLSSGVEHAAKIRLDVIVERGVQAARMLPARLVYAGFSLGVLPAQKLAQTRQNAAGALFFSACAPVAAFGSPWPRDVPVQVHAMESDKLFVEEGDLNAARALVASAENGELFLYPGDQHLFADSNLPSYDEEAAALLTSRAIRFLDATR